MDSHAFERLLATLNRLTHEQLDELEQTLLQSSSPEQAQHIIEARLDGHACCPHCAGTRLYRHGQAHGLAR